MLNLSLLLAIASSHHELFVLMLLYVWLASDCLTSTDSLRGDQQRLV